MPVHPRTRQAMTGQRVQPVGIQMIEPLGYLDMMQLVHHAVAVFTDSGGLQKEAYFHRVPCVTLRDETEWVETVEAGWNRLWTTTDYAPRRDIEEYGTGDAATRIAELMRAAL
jgi:UDP-GlcNAc3NAcA epimerase